jgi:flavin reductase (DIM6/NTAB) family NADH-FMN oxidoreductase RutF
MTAAVRNSRETFRDVMCRHTCGVVIVTHDVEGRPWGTTVTSFLSVSDQPPTILVSLDAGSTSADAIRESRTFGVSILAHDQEEIARHCSRRGGLKFIDRFPAVEPRALGHLACEVTQVIEAGDHVLVVGFVAHARSGRDTTPLLYHRRLYRLLDVA